MLLIDKPSMIKSEHVSKHLFLYYERCVAINRLKDNPPSEGNIGGIWTCKFGISAVIKSFQKKHKADHIDAAREISRNPDTLPSWLLKAEPGDLRRLKSLLKNYPRWGTEVYNYLLTCWCVSRCQSQLVLRVRAKTPDGVSRVRLLRDHVKAIERLAQSMGEPVFWVFDFEYPRYRDKDKFESLHVHVYGNDKLLKAVQDFNGLFPFMPRYTIHTAIRPVSKPRLLRSGSVTWPVSDSAHSKCGYLNTLAYAASKVVGLASGPKRAGISPWRRNCRHGRVKALFKGHHGGQYRHWGYSGFTLV